MTDDDDVKVTSIDQVLDRFPLQDTIREPLQAALLEREDSVCDLLRLAGQQFGLFPQIVAEVLAEVGMGSPISAEQREMVRNQFAALMEQLRQEHENGHEGEQPA